MWKILLTGCFLPFIAECLESAQQQMDPSTDFNKAHLEEDLEGVIDKKPEDMDTKELQFHYFRQHDYDGDEKLDGNEIVMSIFHHSHSSSEEPAGPSYTDDQLIAIVDEVLKYQDKNGDGKIDFQEYITPYQPEDSKQV
ncbi:unnamed protein product [Clavelina lepadiformis]|uniref:EF-hand domain-containing protein n=1 Tax=Clavelina lepadiformis TaxID=159417 RepID=A0ABP0G243_CLALP